MSKRTIAIAVGVAVLAVPGAAVAKPGHGKGHEKVAKHEKHGSKGNKPKKAKSVRFIFKGVYKGAGVITVEKGNAHTHRAGYFGQDVTFDLSNAKLVVADTDGVAGVSAEDLQAGDRVLVQARLPRGTQAPEPAEAETETETEDASGDDAPATTEETAAAEAGEPAAIVARKVVDKTHPPVVDAEDEEADEAPEATPAP